MKNIVKKEPDNEIISDYLDAQEVKIVQNVLRTTAMEPQETRALLISSIAIGANKEHGHVLKDLTATLYNDSESPVENYACAKCCSAMGASFAEMALHNYQQFFDRYNKDIIRIIKKVFPEFNISVEYSIVAQLQSTIGNHKEATGAAIKAEKYNDGSFFWVPKFAPVILKYSADECLKYLQASRKSRMYKDYTYQIDRIENDIKTQIESGKVIVPNPYKPSKKTLEFDKMVHAAALDFFPGGRYYIN